jgi:hypothetical protein
MRKRCRTRVRSRGKVVLNAYSRMVSYFAYTQLSNKWREWTFRTVSQRQAELLVEVGEAVPITRMADGAVRIVGFRATKPTSWERPSPATLTWGTMCAVGNQDADGKDDIAARYRLTGRERREIVKFKVWPLIGDTKAVAVRPRITDAERREAEKLLRRPVVRQSRALQQQSGMLSAA